MSLNGHQPDARRKDPGDSPDRAAIFGRMVSYFQTKEHLGPKAWGQQSALAEKLAVGISTVNSWYRGRSLPDILTFARFARLYPLLNLRWLLFGHGQPEGTKGTSTTERQAGALEAWAAADLQLQRIEALVRDIRQGIPGATAEAAAGPDQALRQAIDLHRSMLRQLEAAAPPVPGSGPRPRRRAE
jgi:transcriptional regulator with XRE-family HTH domain